LPTLFVFSDYCTRSAGQPITSRNAFDIVAHFYVFVLWFLFTTWQLWSVRPEGKTEGDANVGVNTQHSLSDYLTAAI
jgi:hypothetical protein